MLMHFLHFTPELGRRKDTTTQRQQRVKLRAGGLSPDVAVRRRKPEQAKKVQLRPCIRRELDSGMYLPTLHAVDAFFCDCKRGGLSRILLISDIVALSSAVVGRSFQKDSEIVDL